MNKSKLNRYRATLGISAIAGQVFREKPKKHRLSAEISKLIERGTETDDGDRRNL